MCGVKLRDFLLVLRTRWLIVVGCVLVVTGVAAALTYSQTPLYTAQAKFYLSAEPDSPARRPCRTSSPRRTSTSMWPSWGRRR